MSELKPCPVCGGGAEVYSHFSCVYELIYGRVRCKRCGEEVPGKKMFDTYGPSYEGYATPEWVRNAHATARQSAIEEWNRRAGGAEG